MASGRKNYFRHSFFARNDPKLLDFRDEVGIGFYFYYFSLLELCGEQSSENLKDFYEFHHSTIRRLWGTSMAKSEKVADKMRRVGLLEFQKREKTFIFTIPNFAKFMGKYTNKMQPNVPNKRKEKEIKEKKRKEKESKENEPNPSALDTLNYLNEKADRQFRPTQGNLKFINARLNEGHEIDALKSVIDLKCYEWLDDEKMKKYLRPQTLFNSEKFDGYVQEASEELEKIREEQEEAEAYELFQRQKKAWVKAGRPAKGTPEYEKAINSVQ